MAVFPSLFDSFMQGRQLSRDQRFGERTASLIEQILASYDSPEEAAAALGPALMTGSIAGNGSDGDGFGGGGGQPLNLLASLTADPTAEPSPAFSFGERRGAQVPIGGDLGLNITPQRGGLLDQILGEPRSIAGQRAPIRGEPRSISGQTSPPYNMGRYAPLLGDPMVHRMPDGSLMGGSGADMLGGGAGADLLPGGDRLYPSGYQRTPDPLSRGPLPLNPPDQPFTPAPPQPPNDRRYPQMAGGVGSDAIRGGAGADRLAPSPAPGFVQFGQQAGAGAVGDGKYGVPDDLWARQLRQESGGRHFERDGRTPRRSSAGAIGIAQVMPTTGPEAARYAGLPWDENRYRNDPRYNEQIGRAYMGEMLRRFGGDQAKALAAYNAGPARVASGGSLPAETRNYVASIMGAPAGGGSGSDTMVGQAGTDTLGAAPAAGGLSPALQALMAQQGGLSQVARLQLQLAAELARAGDTRSAVSLLGDALGGQGGTLIPLPDGTILQRSADGGYSEVYSPAAAQVTWQPVTLPDGTLAQRSSLGQTDIIQATPEPVVVNGRLVDRRTGELVADYSDQGTGGAFAGTSMDAQDSNILLSGDPASPEYAMAYARQFQTPKFVLGPNGMVPIYVPAPPGIRPPTGRAQVGGATAAPVAGGAPGQPVAGAAIPGTEPARPFTGEQRQAAAFASRIEAANQIFDELDAAGWAPDLAGQAVAGMPGGNLVVGAERQRFDQAVREFVNAILRKESGAAIAQSEFDSAAKQYFAQPGDRPEVLEQKRVARQRAAENMRLAAGATSAGAAPAGTPQGPAATRPRAVNPDTGAAVEWDGQAWVPVQ